MVYFPAGKFSFPQGTKIKLSISELIYKISNRKSTE